jgi:hypothetical protein
MKSPTQRVRPIDRKGGEMSQASIVFNLIPLQPSVATGLNRPDGDHALTVPSPTAAGENTAWEQSQSRAGPAGQKINPPAILKCALRIRVNTPSSSIALIEQGVPTLIAAATFSKRVCQRDHTARNSLPCAVQFMLRRIGGARRRKLRF